MTYGHPSKWHTEAHRPLSAGYNDNVLKRQKDRNLRKLNFSEIKKVKF
jgi:hypothetical protein